MLKSFIKNCLFGVNLRVTKANTLLAAHDELFEYSFGTILSMFMYNQNSSFILLSGRIPTLTDCLEKSIWDNISVIIHGKLCVWNKAT